MTSNSALQVFKGGWEELESAVFTDNTTPTVTNDVICFYITPDGTKLITPDFSDGSVNMQILSTAWDVNSAGPIQATFDVSIQDFMMIGISFRSNGLRMYLSGNSSDTIFQYDLSIPFDITTAVYNGNSFTPGGTFVQTLTFSKNGDFFYFYGVGDNIYQFTLSTPWEITSATNEFIFTPNDSQSITFKAEGDRVYIGHFNGQEILEYTVSTPFDLSSTVVLIGTQDVIINPYDLQLKPNGSDIIILDNFTHLINKLHFDIAYNILTASYFSNSFSLPTSSPKAISWKPDGSKFFIADSVANEIGEYIPDNPWNIDKPSTGIPFDISLIESDVAGMFWRTNGARCYIVGNENKELIQLDAATKYLASSLSNPSISYVINEIASLTVGGIYFRSDGLKWWVSTVDGAVFEYTMSTAWDITTSMYTGNTIAISNANDIFFSSNGRNMYTVNVGSGHIERFVLGVRWELSSAVATDFIDIAGLDADPEGLFIRQNDGKKLFFTGVIANTVLSLDMSLEFNNSLIDQDGNELVTDLGERIVWV